MLVGLVVVLAILLVVALVVERQVLRRAPAEAERRLTAWLGAETTVVAGGRPRDWLRRRAVPAVALAVDDLPIQDGRARIQRLEVELHGVRLVGAGDDRRVMADTGSFRATLTEAAVRSLVELPPLVRRLDLRDDRVRLWTSAGLSVDVRVSARGGDLVLKPLGNPLDALLPFRHVIRLDTLPAGATVERVSVQDGHLVLSGPIDGERLAG